MYIKREAARELIKNFGKGAVSDGRKTLDPVDDIILLAGGVDLIPSADVVEVRHREWRKEQFVGRCGFFSVKDFTCGECGENFEVGQGKGLMHFCPNCSAKMDGMVTDE